MKGQRQEPTGQRAALERLRGRGAAPAVVRGPSGSGKTALVRAHLAETGAAAVELAPGADWDEFRAGPLLAAVRADFEAFSGVPRLAEAVGAVSALCRPDTYGTPAGRHRLLGAVGALLARVRERTRLTVVFDAADDLPAAALVPVQRAGHTAIACAVRAPELCALTDLVIELAPLSEDDAGLLLRQSAAAPVDEAAVRALRRGLGPLFGNPGTLVGAVEAMKESGALVKVHGVLTVNGPVALHAGHPLLAGVDAVGEVGRVLVRLAAGPGLRVDDIPALAAATGRPATDWGRAVDRLVPLGALAHDEHGTLTCPVPALAAITVDQGELSRAASAAVAGRDHGGPRRVPGVAGGARFPRAPFAVGTAGRAGVECAETIRHLIAAADYAALADFAAATHDGDRGELAAAAALAALHIGRPIPAAVRGRLAGPAIDLADRWFDRRAAPIGRAEVAAALRPLRHRPADTAPSADDAHDLVPMLSAVLGPRYTVPADGPIADFHRVSRGYAEGDWSAAMSAARGLELRHPALPVTDAARLIAAEICGWRGEERQAAAWLGAVAEDTPFPGLRGWVATGLRDHAGEDAFTHGWKWYTEHRARLEEPGAARLLARLAAIATDAYGARAVQRETEARCGRTSETGLLVRGIVEADPACVRAAERVIRARGDRFGLAVTCLGLARISAEPRPWLSEAYELASAMGAVKLVTSAKRTMAGRGVAVPARRARRSSEMSDVELRIVGLIRSGRTNRQIAAALGVSAKTVEKHLTRLFAKAGCRTRHGLAMSGLGAEAVGA